MQIRPFDPTTDLQLVEGWLDRRHVAHARGRADLLPPTGFVVDESLVGFLFRTDAPGVAYLDCFASDPSSDKERVRRAMIVLVARLQEEARASGVRMLHGSTAIPSILQACQANGWTVGTSKPYTGLTFAIVALDTKETN